MLHRASADAVLGSSVFRGPVSELDVFLLARTIAGGSSVSLPGSAEISFGVRCDILQSVLLRWVGRSSSSYSLSRPAGFVGCRQTQATGAAVVFIGLGWIGVFEGSASRSQAMMQAARPRKLNE